MKESVDLNKIKQTAENYYRNGDFYCSEAIVKTIKDEFDLPLPDDVIAMASGFPVGIGNSGCRRCEQDPAPYRQKVVLCS